MSRAVIFDMDGVLVDSAVPHQQSWNLALRRRGYQLDDSVFDDTFGQTTRDIVRLLLGEDVADELVRDLDAEKEAAYRDLVRGRVPVMPGAIALLARLHGAGWKLAVGTSGPPENLALVLDEAALRPFFAATVDSSQVRRGKPAPDIFELAAARLSVRCESCIVIEDAPAGVRAARAAGMIAVGLTSTHDREALERAGAAACVTHLDEVDSGFLARWVSDSS